MSEGTVEQVIDNLTDELEPVKPLAHPCWRVIPWLLFSAAYIAGSIHYLGLRPDFDTKIYDPVFLFEMILLSSMVLSAALCSAWLCVPDMRGQKWMLPIPFTLLITFVIWVALRTINEDLGFTGMHWMHCYEDSMLMGIVPALFIVYLAMKGTTTMPYMMVFMNALAVGALGYIGLRFACMNDMFGHILVYHFMPYVVFGSVLGFAARRLFKW